MGCGFKKKQQIVVFFIKKEIDFLIHVSIYKYTFKSYNSLFNPKAGAKISDKTTCITNMSVWA